MGCESSSCVLGAQATASLSTLSPSNNHHPLTILALDSTPATTQPIFEAPTVRIKVERSYFNLDSLWIARTLRPLCLICLVERAAPPPAAHPRGAATLGRPPRLWLAFAHDQTRGRIVAARQSVARGT